MLRTIPIALALFAGCKGDKSNPPPPPAPTEVPAITVNQLLGNSPTFVAGTAGDDFSDARIATQIGLMRGYALPDAPQIDDVVIARDGWPKTPVLYGNEDTNAALASIAARLPFAATRKSIAIGGETFKGPGYRLVTAIPADGDRPATLLYAGTGIAGIAEINSYGEVDAPVIVLDTFGVLVTGKYVRRGDKLAVELGNKRRRIEYRKVSRDLRIGSVVFLFPEMVPERPEDAAVFKAASGALATVAKRLDLDDILLAMYIYPDRRSKEGLTGRAADGHAVPSSRALHIIGTPGPALEELIAHEATHSIAYYAWGPAGTALMGEGLAVWVAGGYQGKPLAKWAKEIEPISVADLLSVKWQSYPEARKYPLAGLLVDVAIDAVGAEKVRRHLLGATFETWGEACKAAGTSAADLEARLLERLGNKK